MSNQADGNQTFALTTAELLDLFETGDVEIEGRMPDSSNLTLLVTVSASTEPTKPSPANARLTNLTTSSTVHSSGVHSSEVDESEIGNPEAPGDLEKSSHLAIYKPGKGERPLADFPPGLFRREVAMFEVSDALGWDVIPATALIDGPLGEGSAQAFVDANFEHHYFSLFEAGLGDEDLKKLCALDFITNNADRKSGHCLQAKNGRVLGIDHGLTFHTQSKLRTVIWNYVDEPLGDEVSVAIEQLLDSGIKDTLAALLTTIEIDALLTRAKALHSFGVFPADDTGGHRWPWPLI